MFLTGFKTYIVAGLMIVKGLYAMWTGETEGVLSQPDYELIMQGMGLSALRAGVTASGPKKK